MTKKKVAKKATSRDAKLGREIDKLMVIGLAIDNANARVKSFKEDYAEQEQIVKKLMDAVEIDSASGTKAKVKIDRDLVPNISDWAKFYAHVAKTKSFDLLQKRASVTAFRERWEAGKKIPGTEQVTLFKLKLSKKK